MIGCVYKIVAVEGEHVGFVYVGRSVDRDARRRFNAHCRGECKSSFVDRYIQKYGKSAVRLEVVELVEGENKKDLNKKLNEREIYWIGELGCVWPLGMNFTKGGAGVIPCEDVIRRISEAQKGEKSAWFGKKRTEENKQRLSKAKLGVKRGPLTEEWKDNLSKACMGKQNSLGFKHPPEFGVKVSARVQKENNPFWGKKHTEETKQKMRESHHDYSGDKHPRFGKHCSDKSIQKYKETQLNKKGSIGVSFNKKLLKWSAYVRYQERQVYLGIFTDKQDAMKAHDCVERILFAEYAVQNRDLVKVS